MLMGADELRDTLPYDPDLLVVAVHGVHAEYKSDIILAHYAQLKRVEKVVDLAYGLFVVDLDVDGAGVRVRAVVVEHHIHRAENTGGGAYLPV